MLKKEKVTLRKKYSNKFWEGIIIMELFSISFYLWEILIILKLFLNFDSHTIDLFNKGFNDPIWQQVGIIYDTDQNVWKCWFKIGTQFSCLGELKEIAPLAYKKYMVHTSNYSLTILKISLLYLWLSMSLCLHKNGRENLHNRPWIGTESDDFIISKKLLQL